MLLCIDVYTYIHIVDFKYKKGSDSVLVVNNADYDSCNTNNPIQKMDGGDSYFTFDKSGPMFFISGISENCKKGQKMEILVLAIRNRAPPPSMGAPAPWSGSPGGSPPAPWGGSPSGSPPAPWGGSPGGGPPAPAGESPPTMPMPGEGPTSGDNYQWPSPPPATPSGSTRFGGYGVGMILLLSCFVGLV